MHLILFVGRHLSSFLLSLSLLALVSVLGFTLVVFNQQTIKESLAESGIYDEFIASTIDRIQTESEEMSDLTEFETGLQPEEETEFLPLNDQELKQVVNDSIPPATVQKHTETLISSLFRWLEKVDDNIEFTIDMTDTKNLFIANLSNFAAEKVTALPECTLQDLSSVDTTDVFDLKCRPPGFSASQASEVVVKELSNGEFLQDPIITEDFLNENNQNDSDDENVQEKLSFLPNIFSTIKNAKVLVVIILILSLIAYVFTRKPYINGFSKLGRKLTITGLITFVVTLVFKILIPNIKISSGTSQDRLSELANDALIIHLDKLGNFILLISFIVFLTGLTLVILVHINKPKTPKIKSKK